MTSISSVVLPFIATIAYVYEYYAPAGHILKDDNWVGHDNGHDYGHDNGHDYGHAMKVCFPTIENVTDRYINTLAHGHCQTSDMDH